jgi:hypothetical protein
MSVLNGPFDINSTLPANIRAANVMRQQARAVHNYLVHMFNEGAKRFWANPNATPAEIAHALGQDGKEIFELHGKLGALLATIKPEDIAEGLGVVGSFSYSEDGRIVLPE